MEIQTYFKIYPATLMGCVLMVLSIIKVLSPGIKNYMTSIFQDPEISHFFFKMIRLVLFLGGIGAALTFSFSMNEKSNWLTISWEATQQFQLTLKSLFESLMAFTVVFLVLHLLNKLLAK